MKLIEENITQTINEAYIVETLNLNNKTILELGCGNAIMTKSISKNGFDRKIIACETDEIQHKKNLELNYENIDFKLMGAQKLDIESNSIDIIFMFKSFHHIPISQMTIAMKEIKRVLKANGLVYISEPLFAGEQNELISLFHNEEKERKIAFETIKKSVENEDFKLFREIFFQTEITYKNFEDFQKKQMNLTYNHDYITQELKEKVEKKFNSYNNGEETTFMKPFRIDILQKIV